jgi:hypothetical protein
VTVTGTARGSARQRPTQGQDLVQRQSRDRDRNRNRADASDKDSSRDKHKK